MLDYLVYSINEGLYSTNFSLRNFFEQAKCNQPDMANPQLKDLLVFFWRFVRADDHRPITTIMISESLSVLKIVQKFVMSNNQNYIYNPVVFQVLIKNNFIYAEMQKDLSTYCKFLNYFLKSDTTDIQIKNSILHSIINAFEAKGGATKTKEFREAIDRNTNLLITIIECLHYIRNVDFLVFGLSALTCIAMEKENLQNFMVKEGDIIPLITQILKMPFRSPHIRTAVFSLVKVLTKNPQNKEKLAEQLKEYLLSDLRAMLHYVDPKQSGVAVRLVEICHKLIKQDSFRNKFNDMKLIDQIISDKVYYGYMSDRLKEIILLLFVLYYDISTTMSPPEDNVVNFVISCFLGLTEKDIEDGESKIISLTLYCLYSIEGTNDGRKKIRESGKVSEIEEQIKNFLANHPKLDNKQRVMKIKRLLIPKEKVQPKPAA